MRNKNIFAVTWAFLLGLAWLIPNHYRPWTSFHSDAWIAFVGLFLLVPVILTRTEVINLPSFSVLALLLAIVPWIHHSVGMIPFAGQAWVASTYLQGFGLAIIVGDNLGRRFNVLLPDALFGAILLASIVSVGLSLGSWAEVIDSGLDDYLSMGYSGGRHYANLGQPNMLGSLLLWGVVGCFWAYVRKTIGLKVAVLTSIFLVVGIVLTRSRTAYVAGIIVVCLQFIFWQKIKSKKIYLLTAVCVGGYLLWVPTLNWLDIHIFQRIEVVDYVRSATTGDIRLAAWKIFVDAITDSPWVGYGWTEVANAQIAVADRHPSLGGMFGHTHNLILDLFVWVGIPLGLFVLGYVLKWIFLAFRHMESEQDFLLLMVLVVIGIHSMLEYPLQYAIFLLPTGLFVGVVCNRIRTGYVLKSSAIFLAFISLCFTIQLAGIARDYSRIEDSYNKWRFDFSGLIYPNKNTPNIPEVLYLTHFRSWFEIVRNRPSSNMSELELSAREKAVRAFPSSGGIFELALAYALNEDAIKASYWLARVCKLSSETECINLQRAWRMEADKHPQLKLVQWPNTDGP